MDGVVVCRDRFPVIAFINKSSEPEVETAVIVEELAKVMTVSVGLDPV